MLGFDDSSFLKEYDSFIPSVFRQNSNSNPPESTTNEHPEEPTVVDYIPDVEYNSEGEAFDIIYISSDESCYEDAEEEWTDPSNQEQEPVIETQTHNEDLIIISSDEEELPISSICSKRKRKSYSPPIVRRPKISRVNTRRRHNNVRQRHRKVKKK
jgi:hypothetical protein